MRFIDGEIRRDYTLINAPQDPELVLLARRVPEGRFSPLLAGADPGEVFTAEGPFGYFSFQTSSRPAVWIATGTGIAPFIAFVRAGMHCRIMLHGVRRPDELYFHGEMRRGAQHFVACISGSDVPADCFRGRVTEYLERRLPDGVYDFYLCGRQEMIASVTALIDRRFEDSHVFSEAFF